ncbi:ectonucleotide pyrophosphatase/phosphodiesterase family member 5 [Callorhinchus milii]|uniref:Ectonucleotide pyrophosphatase/phosphodiesterase 5 n=1 Tax=Callorhinchus milii TaxID=7868 RepID=A0A4W3I443_CALMI|nr:ectonucleotide pyrophosphatase/phosphodiesterase family member 5 [Callorhinchus milii]|eukprot:gi/632970121/ref/XP_007901470.1/ PREDICTED: ectonucleotide pyrophosphatase/phosphodiesterase family member 5 [Callorhinchus milii]
MPAMVAHIYQICLWQFLLCFTLTKVVSIQLDQPRVLLVSFDGFRWDYIYRVPTPHFKYIMENGIHVKRVTDVFITKTFPNHYSLVTGLYAESHGIVSNEMYDPDLNISFSMDKSNALNPVWWEEAYPLWITNQIQGHKSGAAMWPGTDVQIHGIFPTHYMPYNISVSFEDRVARLIDWFTGKDPVNFGVLYWEEPDISGHNLGPDSVLMNDIIADIDLKLGYLITQLQKAGLWETLNIIVTSDHGMAQCSKDRIIELDRYVNNELYTWIDFSPVSAILPKPDRYNDVYNALINAHPNMTVYKKEEIPDRFHYKHNNRIQPIIAVADEGWTIDQNISSGIFLLGNHGYDNTLQSMHPIFVAHGPAFKKNFTKEAIRSVDIYPLICHILGLDPMPNNGSFKNVQELLTAVKLGKTEKTDLENVSHFEINTGGSYAWLGILLGSVLVVGFLIVFVLMMTKSQMSILHIHHGEMAQPLLPT